MIYQQAREIATRILKQLEPFCKRIDVAGSVRREKNEVKDIEICCVPRTIENKDLFGNIQSVSRANNFVSEVMNLGIIGKGDPKIGRYCQIMLPDSIMLDLFMPIEEDYFRQFCVRTGSSDYSHKVIATAWNKLGWVGTDDGLRLQKECYKKEVGKNSNGFPKLKWICNNPNPTLPPVWQSEIDFFHWLNLQWIEPSKRYV